MNLGVSTEQRELRESVRRFLAERASLTRVRDLMETPDGTDPDVWRQAGAQLGLPGIAVPEEYGGAGFSFAEQAIVLEELARYDVSTAICCQLAFNGPPRGIEHLGPPAMKDRWLPEVARGEAIISIGITEPDAGSAVQNMRSALAEVIARTGILENALGQQDAALASYQEAARRYEELVEEQTKNLSVQNGALLLSYAFTATRDDPIALDLGLGKDSALSLDANLAVDLQTQFSFGASIGVRSVAAGPARLTPLGRPVVPDE